MTRQPDRRARTASKRLASILLVLAVLALAGLGSAGAQAVRSTSAASAVPISSLTQEDLAAAVLSPSDARRFFPEGAKWWPSLPEFNSASLDPAPGKRFWVVQSYKLVDGGRLTGPEVQAPLTLYASPAAAAKDFAAIAKTRDAPSTRISGPAVGDESRYFTRPADGKLTETTLRFRLGSVVGRISALDTHPWRTSDLALDAAPVLARIQALLEGRLRGATLPNRLALLLPPPSFSDLPGVASAVVPAEAWALVDSSGKAGAVRDFLRQNGAGSLVMRSYDLLAPAGQVIEITLFPFKTPKAAETWVGGFAREAQKAGRLDPGHTGPLSAFTSYKGKFYELQFAQGRYVADISCFAPFGTTSPACESRVRELAGIWYLILPQP